MSNAARRGSFVALTLGLAGCAVSHDVVREESPPVADAPRTAPSAREQALNSIPMEPPSPHLNRAMIRRAEAEKAAEAEAARGPAFHGLGLAAPNDVGPVSATPAEASPPAGGPATPAPGPQGWVTGGPWRDWSGAAQAATDDDSDEEEKRWNDGQDPLRPIRRAELRFAYSDLHVHGTPGITPNGKYGVNPGPENKYEVGVTTFRLDVPTGFPDRWIIHGWKLATTIEVPYVSTDVPGPDSPKGREAGLGDVTAQMIMIPTPPGPFEWGGGLKAGFPTARMEQMGTGRYTMAPTAILMWHPEWMRHDGFFGFTLRDTFDTGLPYDRENIHYGTIQPQFQWNFPRNWFVASAPEIRCDFHNENKWYVPADLMVGKMLSERWLMSLDGQYAITNHLDLPTWTVEARLAFFF